MRSTGAGYVLIRSLGTASTTRLRLRKQFGFYVHDTFSEGVTVNAAKRLRTIGRYEPKQKEYAKTNGLALVTIEINDYALPDPNNCNLQSKGPAGPEFAAAVRELMRKSIRGEFDRESI